MRRSVSSLPHQATQILGPVMRSYVACWTSYARIARTLPGDWLEFELGMATHRAIQVGYTQSMLMEAIFGRRSA